MRSQQYKQRKEAAQEAKADDVAGSAADNGNGVTQPLSVRANMLYNVIGSLSYQLCLWLTTMLVVMLSDGYGNAGMLAFAMTIGNMMSGIGTYDMRTYQVSDVRHEYTQGEYVGFRLVTLAIGIAVTIAYATFTSPDAATLAATIAYILFKTDESFADVLYGVEQIAGRMDFIGKSEMLRGVLVVAAFATTLRCTGSILVAIIAMLPVGLAVTVLYDIPHARRLMAIRPKIARETTIRLLMECLPIVIGMTLIGMTVSVPRQYYANAYGSEELGIYATIATPAVLVQAAARYLYAPLLVGMAERWKVDGGHDMTGKNGKGGFWRYTLKVIAIMVVLIAISIPVLSMGGKWLLGIVYGDRTSGYTCLLPGALIGTGLMALLGFMSDTLVICRDMRGLVGIAVMSLVLSAALMTPLTAWMGLSGINATVIAATGMGTLMAMFRVRQDDFRHRKSGKV
jgi:O-antigen/teichoic acid export membrane protein